MQTAGKTNKTKYKNEKQNNIFRLKHHNTEKYSTGNDLHFCSIFHPELSSDITEISSFIPLKAIILQVKVRKTGQKDIEKKAKIQEKRGRIGNPTFQESFTKNATQNQVMALHCRHGYYLIIFYSLMLPWDKHVAL